MYHSRFGSVQSISWMHFNVLYWCHEQDIVAFLLSPEARQLRPLLISEAAGVADLWLRDQLQRAYNALPTLAPRLPFLPALPLPPLPPVCPACFVLA